MLWYMCGYNHTHRIFSWLVKMKNIDECWHPKDILFYAHVSSCKASLCLYPGRSTMNYFFMLLGLDILVTTFLPLASSLCAQRSHRQVCKVKYYKNVANIKYITSIKYLLNSCPQCQKQVGCLHSLSR